jgi:hypothetical protein
MSARAAATGWSCSAASSGSTRPPRDGHHDRAALPAQRRTADAPLHWRVILSPIRYLPAHRAVDPIPVRNLTVTRVRGHHRSRSRGRLPPDAAASGRLASASWLLSHGRPRGRRRAHERSGWQSDYARTARPRLRDAAAGGGHDRAAAQSRMTSTTQPNGAPQPSSAGRSRCESPGEFGSGGPR